MEAGRADYGAALVGRRRVQRRQVESASSRKECAETQETSANERAEGENFDNQLVGHILYFKWTVPENLPQSGQCFTFRPTSPSWYKRGTQGCHRLAGATRPQSCCYRPLRRAIADPTLFGMNVRSRPLAFRTMKLSPSTFCKDPEYPSPSHRHRYDSLVLQSQMFSSKMESL